MGAAKNADDVTAADKIKMASIAANATDELSSAIGVALALGLHSRLVEVLTRVQNELFDLGAVTQQLEEEAIDKFNKPYDRLMATLEQKRAAAPMDRRRLTPV